MPLKRDLGKYFLFFSLGFVINVAFSFTRSYQNTFYTLIFEFFGVIGIVLTLKPFVKKNFLITILIGIIIPFSFAYLVNPKNWLAVLIEFIVTSSTYLTVCYYNKVVSWQVLLLFLIFGLIVIHYKVIEPLLYLKTNLITKEDATPIFFSADLIENINLKDTSGSTYDLKNLKGKVLLIDFWFGGCKPCLIKENSLSKIAEYFSHDTSFKVITINSGEFDSFEDFKKHKFPSPFIFSLYDVNLKMSSRMHVYGYPTEFIINKKGQISSTFSGFIENVSNLYLSKTKYTIDNLLKQDNLEN